MRLTSVVLLLLVPSHVFAKASPCFRFSLLAKKIPGLVPSVEKSIADATRLLPGFEIPKQVNALTARRAGAVPEKDLIWLDRKDGEWDPRSAAVGAVHEFGHLVFKESFVKSKSPEVTALVEKEKQLFVKIRALQNASRVTDPVTKAAMGKEALELAGQYARPKAYRFLSSACQEVFCDLLAVATFRDPKAISKILNSPSGERRALRDFVAPLELGSHEAWIRRYQSRYAPRYVTEMTPLMLTDPHEVLSPLRYAIGELLKDQPAEKVLAESYSVMTDFLIRQAKEISTNPDYRMPSAIDLNLQLMRRLNEKFGISEKTTIERMLNPSFLENADRYR